MAGKGFLASILIGLFFILYREFFYTKKLCKIKGDQCLSLILAILYTLARGFTFGNALSVLYRPRLNLLKSAVLISGVCFLYLFGIRFIHHLLSQKELWHSTKKATQKKKNGGKTIHGSLPFW
ncbi:MAG: hypothetical protein J5935_05700 [Lachnospiraceae bacterium]|nr:hypothetical protein [Lachnospiraceae bacterium]